MVTRSVDPEPEAPRNDQNNNGAADPLEPLVIAVQEAVAAGTPLPSIDDTLLSDGDRARFDSLCALIKSLHRLREPVGLDSQKAIAAPTTENLVGLLGIQRHIGRFGIQRLLGHGGHGIVYLAFDPILNRQVALKIPRPEVLVDPEMRDRFLREARSAAGLDHRNIVSIYEAGTAGEVCFIAMALCSGRSLAEFLAERPKALSWRGWARTFMELAEVLEYTHCRGILHRDLKPGNILLFPLADDSSCPSDTSDDRPPFVPKMTDFGLARIIEESVARTRTSLALGTPLYMSPEQASMHPDDVDGRCDVHALGVIMYETLAGKPPFAGTSLLSVLEAVRHHQPPAPQQLVPSIPRDLSTICMKCLEKRPSRRYQRAADLAADLGRFLNHEPIEAKQSKWTERWFLWCERCPAAAALIALSMLAFVGGLIGSLLHRHQVAELDAQNRASEYSRLVNEAEGLVAKPHVGWSWAGLDKLSETLRHDVPDRDVVKLRSAAAAFLTGTDLRQVATIAPGIRGYCLAFSRNGVQLAVGENSNEDAGRIPVEVWEFAVRRRIWRLTFPSDHSKAGQLDGVRSLLFMRDGRRLIAGTRQGAIYVWDLTASPPKRSGWKPHSNWVTSLVELDDGDILTASMDGTMRHLDLATGSLGAAQQFGGPISDLRIGRLRATNQADRPIMAGCIGEQLRVLHRPAGADFPGGQPPNLGVRFFGPIVDGHALPVAIGDEISLIDLKDKSVLRTFLDIDTGTAHDSEVRFLDVSPDGRLLASGGSDGRVKLWDMAAAVLKCSLLLDGQDNVAVKFHPSGKYLVATSGLETHILEIGGSQYESIASWQRSAINGFGSSESQMVTMGQPLPIETTKSQVRLDVGGTKPGPIRDVAHAQIKSLPFTDPTQDAEYSLFCNRWQPPVSVTVRPRRLGFAYIGGDDFLELLADGLHREIVQKELQAIGFSADGDYLWGTYAVLTPGFDKPIGALGAWRVSDLSKAAEWVNLDSKRQGQMNGLYNLAVSKSWLAVASSDETVKLFRPEIPQPKLVNTVAIVGDRAESLAFDAAESLLAIGTRRGNLMLVHPGSGRKLADTQPQADSISSIAFSADGRLLATGCYDHSVRLWSVRNDQVKPILSLPLQSNRIVKVTFAPNDDVLYVLVQYELALRTFRLKELYDALKRLSLEWN